MTFIALNPPTSSVHAIKYVEKFPVSCENPAIAAIAEFLTNTPAD
jgi:hypothetical protein